MISLKTPTGSKILNPRGLMNAAGVKKSINRIALRTASGNIDVWTPAEVVETLVVTTDAPGNYVTGFGANTGAATITSTYITASATGAVGAVTWLWEFLSGDPGLGIANLTNPITAFYAVVAADATTGANFTVTVTDSIGRTAQATVGASLTNYLWGG